MPTVVARVVPSAAVDAVDAGLRPRQGIGQPSRQFAVVLSGAQLHAVALPLAGQHQSFDLDLTAERFPVAVVDHMVCLTVVGLQ